ncbi:MAG: SRPBCC family protein [Solirubrobacterales bacterium]|nr:SRPBCC family protein [Solirubrobacterales bacterium]
MARNEVFIDAPAHAVFDVLADADAYRDWVPGTRDTGAEAAAFPAEGGSFGYSAGLPLLGLGDRTTVLATLPPVMLELRIRATPLISARATIYLQPQGTGTRLTLIEEPASRALTVLIGPAGHALIRLRNVEALRRLRTLVEERLAERRSASRRAGGPAVAA